MFIIYSAASNPFDIPHRRINKLHDRRARKPSCFGGSASRKPVILIILPLRRASRRALYPPHNIITRPNANHGPHLPLHAHAPSLSAATSQRRLCFVFIAARVRVCTCSSMSPLFSQVPIFCPRVWITDVAFFLFIFFLFFFFFSSKLFSRRLGTSRL